MFRSFAMSLIILVPCSLSAAQEPDPLFQSEELLAVTLTGPFDRIDDDRDKDLTYEGAFSYLDQSGQEVVLDVELSVRGNWRLDRRNCFYSQLWLNFDRDQVPGTLFENQNRLKLVVQCRDSGRYTDYLIKEFKAYEIFQRVSDIHYGTRLLNITYDDTERADYSRTQLGFIIEHQDRLGERYGMEDVKRHEISRNELHPEQMTLVSLFQYMIGNWDFSMIRGPEGEECCQNAKLLVNESGENFVVPYDFDSSGYVDVTYAPQPEPDLNIPNSRTRIYRGFCVPQEVLEASMDRFRSAEEEIMAILGDTTYMSERMAVRAIRYIETFFETLGNERRVEREFVRDCR